MTGDMAASAMRATTVLWDIDGTLVRSGGVAARAFLDAVAEVTDVLEVLQRLVGERLDDLQAQTSTYPGVDALLAKLAGAGVRQTVVTGNIAAVARHKLDAGGLIPPVELGF